MPVPRHITALGYRVPVHIEQRARDEPQPRESAFLVRLPHGDLREIGLAIRMPAELQPSVEFSVMREQCLRPRGIHDPRRAREMARQAGAQKTILVRLHEAHDLRPHLGLADITHASEVIAQEL